MTLFICPSCNEHSEIKEKNGRSEIPHMCPHCGQEYKIDRELNVIVDED